MIKYFKDKTFKMAVSATIAIIIANAMNLHFSVTAGIIAILSVQDTKKEALKVAGRRVIATTIAILLSFVLYIILGNNPVIFGIFLVIFIPITKYLKIEDGLVVGAVLSTHLLTSSNINLYWILNEEMLTVIGISIAMVFNLYTESLEDIFEIKKEEIEESYRRILSDMSVTLITRTVPIYEHKLFINTEKLINESKVIAKNINDNYILKSNYYYINYINMRTMQLDTIRRMKKHFLRFNMTYEQTVILSRFTEDVAKEIYENNDCINLINKLDSLRKTYQAMELPKTREEFENRALLFQFLNDLEEFLIIKKEFIESN
ncbi:aromatic acid exporter family protein [uncultured Clostridium sp.]|uniref:aromatic acid exporter family protein n=1 Tax=uncultured Clostridium sp. TaxID=59620 RepID=UPI0025EF8C58|nr:aromatic acid exporter family protein [uncultured Clostridium sp.]